MIYRYKLVKNSEYDSRRRQLEAQEADADDLKMLEDLERRVRESDDKSQGKNE